jgi:histidine triad (HIT) family protein
MAGRDWYCEDVLSGKLDVQRVSEDDRVLAFHHPRPVAEIHVVVIPKSHVPSLLGAAALDGDLLSSMVRAIQVTPSSLGLLDDDRPRGFYVRANAAAPGVTPHMHWHILNVATRYDVEKRNLMARSG